MKKEFTKKEYQTEAKDFIKTIFSGVIKSDKKEDWKKAVEFTTNEIERFTAIGEIHKKHLYTAVRKEMLSKYGKKFIKK